MTLYRFARGAALDGGLLGAMERIQIESGGRVIDALFVMREPDSGALSAIDLAIGARGGTMSALLDFRLDARRRAVLTRRTLGEHPDGVPADLIQHMGATLEAGAAILALLHVGPVPEPLADAASRADAHRLADEPTDAGSLAQAAPHLRAAVTAGSAGIDG